MEQCKLDMLTGCLVPGECQHCPCPCTGSVAPASRRAGYLETESRGRKGYPPFPSFRPAQETVGQLDMSVLKFPLEVLSKREAGTNYDLMVLLQFSDPQGPLDGSREDLEGMPSLNWHSLAPHELSSCNALFVVVGIEPRDLLILGQLSTIIFQFG